MLTNTSNEKTIHSDVSNEQHPARSLEAVRSTVSKVLGTPNDVDTSNVTFPQNTLYLLLSLFRDPDAEEFSHLDFGREVVINAFEELKPLLKTTKLEGLKANSDLFPIKTNGGKDTPYFYPEKMDEYVEMFLKLLGEKSIIGLNYEEIVKSKKGTVLSEALFRIYIGDNKISLHARFLSILEQLGLGFLILKYVLACLFDDIQQKRIGLPISINVTKDDLLHPKLMTTLKKFEEYFGLSFQQRRGKIILEIREKNNILDHSEEISAIEEDLEDVGYVLVLDDLLHDEQSLNQALEQIRDRNPDKVKLDKCILAKAFEVYDQFNKEPNLLKSFQAIFKKFFDQCKNKEGQPIPIIVERIELDEEDYLAFLYSLGFRIFQGYFFSKSPENRKKFKDGEFAFQN